jgi:hypothetical protein
MDEMKSIKPFNRVWLDCYNNLKLSLLIYLNPEYEMRGYENVYKYSHIDFCAKSGKNFNCITEDQYYVEYEEFSYLEKLNPPTEEYFLNIVISHLKSEKGFVLMRTDLYDWLEGSVCWHKFHWDHYSLLVDYNEQDDTLLVYDEAGGQYKSFNVCRKSLYCHLSNNKDFEKIRLITINNDVSLKSIQLSKLVENAKKIVDSIEICTKKEFWHMQPSDYETNEYKDLNGVFLQKIEGRQNANVLFMDMLASKDKLKSREQLIQWKHAFEQLSNEWRNIRIALYIIYKKEKNREAKLVLLNGKIQRCLLTEKKIWEEFIVCMNKNEMLGTTLLK